jgi:hypothetical protein
METISPRYEGLCHHGMARCQVADGGDGFQIWRVHANVLNKQSRTDDRGGPPAWGLGEGLTAIRTTMETKWEKVSQS